MEVIDLTEYEESRFKTAIALGNFDGIHLGHQALIKNTIVQAKEKNLKPALLLFNNHTKTLLKGSNNKKFCIITSNGQKLKIFEELGIETVYAIDFDEKIMRLSADDFIDNIIIRKLNAKLITIGFDYRFGYKAQGDSNYLKKMGEQKGFHVNIIDPIYMNGQIISSTAIRNLIKAGDITKANSYLGRYYAVLGTVVRGKSRGSKLGYPTANISLSYNYVIPKTGVYETITKLEGKEYKSLTNIGYNPTFNEYELKIENHILDFNKDIYGKDIEIKFVDFIRDDIKFKTVDELVKQIEKDMEYIKKHQ